MKHLRNSHEGRTRRLIHAIASLSYALLFGQRWKGKDGARLLSRRETAALLSWRNKGLLLDGTWGRLSERESFQNVCVIARV